METESLNKTYYMGILKCLSFAIAMVGVVAILPTILVIFYKDEIYQLQCFVFPGIAYIFLGYLIHLFVNQYTVTEFKKNSGPLVVVLDLLVAVLELEFELLLEEDEAGLETLDPPDVLVLPDVLTSPDVAVLPDVLELVVLATELDVPLVLLLLTSEELEDDVLVVVVFCVAVLLSVVLEEDLRVCAFAEFVASISTMLIASAVVRYFFIVPWICCNSLFKMRTKVIRSRG